MSAWVWIALAALQAGAPGGALRVDAVSMPAGLKAQDVLSIDFDGDGRPDLVVARSRSGKPFARTLAVHLARAAGGFAPAPDLELEVPHDASAFAVGDVHADPGAEIVLLGATGAFAWRPKASEEQRFVRLCTADFLWQLGDPELVFAWQSALRDLDGDGLVDLLLPEPGGWRIALQKRTAEGSDFARVFALRAPREWVEAGVLTALGRGERSFRGKRNSSQMRLSIGFGSPLLDDVQRGGPLLQVVESTGAPAILDWDGDGDLDLLAQTRTRLCVFAQDQGAFATAPQLAFDLPVPADRSRRLDASYSAQALDLDGDGKADYAVLAGDQRSDDVRTQAQFFLQGKGTGDAAKTSAAPLFGPRALPQQLLVIAGFVAAASFEEVDRDPLPDLVLRTVRPDLIDQLQSISSESIDADVYIYLNQKGTFARRPDAVWRFPFRLRRFSPSARFVGDWNGDGLAEFLVRSEPERVRLFGLRREREGLSVIDKPWWETAIAEDAKLVFPAAGSRRFLIVAPGSVAQVSAR